MKRLSILVTYCLFLASFNLHAEPCTLKVTAVITRGCRQTGLVQAEVVVSSESASADGFNVFVDAVLVQGSPFQYHPSGNTSLHLNLRCDTAMHQIFVHDINDAACTAIVPVECPDCVNSSRAIDGDLLPINPSVQNSQNNRSNSPYNSAVHQPLAFYPNPASSNDPTISLLGIAVSDCGKSGSLSVYSLDGEGILTYEITCEERMSFTLREQMQAGIYVIGLRTAQHAYSGRLIIR